MELTDIKFEVSLAIGDDHPLKYERKNLHMILDNLREGAECTVSVTLVKADNSNVTSLPLKFKTLAEGKLEEQTPRFNFSNSVTIPRLRKCQNPL